MVMDKFEEADEHRQCYRHPSHAAMTVIAESASPDTLCSLKDISFGGMAFRSGHELKVGDRLTARFPDAAPCCEVYGNVVWSRRVDGEFEMGVEFAASDNRREILEKIVEDLAHFELRRLAAA